MSATIERMLQKKFQLDTVNARLVASEARENLQVGNNILWSRILEKECLKITESKGFTKDGLPLAPKRTEFILHSPVEHKVIPRAKSLTVSSSKETNQKPPTVVKEKDRVKSLASSKLTGPRKSGTAPFSPICKSKRRASCCHAPRPTPKKDEMVIPPSPLPTVTLSTIEEHRSSHEATEMKERKSRAKKPQGKPTSIQEPEGAALQGFLANILGRNSKQYLLVQDNFKPLLFDYDLRTLASDGESVSSSNSGWTWGSSTKSSNTTADMGVRQLAIRFEAGRVQQGGAPTKPRRQKSFDDDGDEVRLGPPIETVLLKTSTKYRSNR